MLNSNIMKRYLLLFLFPFTLISKSNGVEFSGKDKEIIITNSLKVLENYQRVINQMGEFVVNDIEKAKGGAEGFLELFVNRQVLIYNDLDPAHKLSEFYEAETYSNNILLWYPDGISITLDLANVKGSEITTHEENVYSIDILVKKTINGNYLNQTLNKNTEELTFRIAFGSEIKDPGSFRIVGIRNAESKFAINDAQALKEVNSVNILPEDLVKIHSEIKTVLQDYRNFLALIGDPQEATEDKTFYKESFMKLFPETGARVYNDIMPAAQTKLIPVTEYLAAYIADYPNGIKNLSINTDSVKFGKVMKADDGSYYTYTDANKFFSGSYKGKDAFREMFPLIFKMSFKAANNTFSEFRITGIDLSSVNFYEATGGAANTGKPEIAIKQISRKGFGITLSGSYGKTSINDANIESMTLDKNYHEWSISPQYGFSVTLGVNYNFTDNISVHSGIEYSKYSTNFNLTGNFTDKDLSSDANGDQYHRVVKADYDSLVTVNYLTLPLLIGYTSGKPGELGFYAEGGVKISIPNKVTFKTTGDYEFYGVYPNFPPSIDTLNADLAPQLGFYNRENINETGETKFTGINLSFYLSAGVNIPLGYYSSVMIGPEINIGISDIMGDKDKYTDIFKKQYDHQPVKLRSFGLRLGFVYKL
jgi:hypothetical protein